MSPEMALVIAITAGVLAIFISSIPTDHHCRERYCPHRKREEEK